MHIEKEKIRVTIMMDRFRIAGDMSRYPGSRLLDLFNLKEATFIAFTEVEIYGIADGKLLRKTPFVALNRNAIHFFYPVDTEHQEKT
ncbi:MAG: hypothetical protein JJE48_02300 [Actinobacteria bacterium]|nr:hypothetical protein [Actinomycetota bacterium]